MLWRSKPQNQEGSKGRQQRKLQIKEPSPLPSSCCSTLIACQCLSNRWQHINLSLRSQHFVSRSVCNLQRSLPAASERHCPLLASLSIVLLCFVGVGGLGPRCFLCPMIMGFLWNLYRNLSLTHAPFVHMIMLSHCCVGFPRERSRNTWSFRIRE